MKNKSTWLRTLCFTISLVLASGFAYGRVAPDSPDVEQSTFRKPRLLSGLGSVEFPISCQSKLAELYFNQGVVLLYQRDEQAAECAFRYVAKLEPKCAMVHWGLAMADRRSPEDAKTHIQNAHELAQSQEISTTEVQLINRFVDDWLGETGSKSMRKGFHIQLNQIGDVEVEALVLLRMLESTSDKRDDKHVALTQRLLRTIQSKNPDHPIQVEWLARFRPDRPDALLPVAKEVCKTMPRASRAWREAAKAYARAEQYGNAVQHFETAHRLNQERMQADRLCPEQVPGHGEAQAGLLENLIRLGRIRDALGVAHEMVATPCLSPDPVGDRADSICVQGQRTVLDLFSRYELWNETIELSKLPVWNTFSAELEAEKLFVLGSASIYTGDADRGSQQVRQLKSLWLKQLFSKNKPDESKSRTARANKAQTSGGLQRLLRQRMEKADAELGRIESAVQRLAIHDAFANKDHTRLADLLDHPPNLPAEQLSRMHLELGNISQAKKFANLDSIDSPHRILRLANQVNVLRETGDEPAVRKKLNELNKATAATDRDLPIIRRLSGFRTAMPAAEATSKERWQPYPITRWQPHDAQELTLPDRLGNLVSLHDYAGQPVLVVFYLGAGCPHCIQQLGALAPLHDEFVDAGIKVITVSTDTIKGMNEMYELADMNGGGEELLPFVMVSDPQLDRFRAFHAFDEFEESPLHGAFLLDASRRVLWQNTGKEPFMQVEFLLEESKRLLIISELESESRPSAASSTALR